MQQAKSVSNREITYKLPTLISRKSDRFDDISGG